MSYRMTEEDVLEANRYFYEKPGSWVELGIQADNLKNEFFLVTGSNKFFQNVLREFEASCVIIEINDAGDAYRIVWGLCEGGKPTSELPTHLMNHAIRFERTDGAERVIYHAHCPELISLTTIVPADPKRLSKILWQCMTECVIVFPDGVGVVPWMIPGGAEIAQATCELMQKHSCVIWCQHGIFCSGNTFDEAFGLMHVIEKSAKIYNIARSANGGKEPEFVIADKDLAEVAQAYGCHANEEFLDL